MFLDLDIIKRICTFYEAYGMGLEKIRNKVINGHILDILRILPDEFVDCVITSPPYWGLRFYDCKDVIWDNNTKCEHEWGKQIGIIKRRESPGVGAKQEINASQRQFCLKCNAWKGQLGLEPSFLLYINHLLQIFDEINRILKPEGTCWVNLGDNYSGSGEAHKSTHANPGISKSNERNGFYKGGKIPDNIPSKSLCQIPYRFSIGMTDRGWVLRNIIIWHKPNCIPQSVKDRFTVDFESIFFFTKQKKYYFKQQLEPTITKDNSIRNRDITKLNNTPGRSKMKGLKVNNYDFKNKRCVWTVSTQSYPEAHYAVFPKALISPMIDAGCPPNGIVLDPFIGSGTVAEVAQDLGRDFLGIELCKEYLPLIQKRLGDKNAKKNV